MKPDIKVDDSNSDDITKSDDDTSINEAGDDNSGQKRKQSFDECCQLSAKRHKAFEAFRYMYLRAHYDRPGFVQVLFLCKWW